MASTNFLVFNESNSPTTTYSDSEYTTATQRLTGVTPGMAISRMHNKMYFQWSAMSVAIAQFIVSKGYDCHDYDINSIVAALDKVCSLNGRQNSTAYTVGDVAYSTNLKSYLFLECAVPGTTAADPPAALTTAAEGDSVTDGTVVWIAHRLTSGFREPSTVYASHDIAYAAGLPAGLYLECTTAGTTSANTITMPLTPSVGQMISDGTVVWTIRKVASTSDVSGSLLAYRKKLIPPHLTPARK